MEGAFEKRPKYSSTWDVDIVLQYLELHYPHDELTLKELSYKLVMLLALLSGQQHCTSLLSSFLTGRMFVCRTYFRQSDELRFVS